MKEGLTVSATNLTIGAFEATANIVSSSSIYIWL